MAGIDVDPAQPPEPSGLIAVRAAGAVLWRDGTDGRAGRDRVEVAVVHRPRYDDWSLPKGKLRAGELAAAAAVREVTEETGFAAVLGRRLRRECYPVPGGTKVVDYWTASSAGGSFEPNDEVDQLRWLLPAGAAALVSYDVDRAVLATFAAAPALTSTVLLVRHAHAGRRRDWPDADELRPLSATGVRQAAALRAFLPLFGPHRVHAAPRVRCVETVRELAADLGTGVTLEPLLAEEGYWPSPNAGMARLLRLAGDAATAVVVSSQGGVIPHLVGRLALRGGVEVGPKIPNEKGSTWVLSLHGDILVAADYYPPPLVGGQ